jgi:glucoamylase
VQFAPGGPGTAPRWTSSAKTGVGTSLNPARRVWFTLSHGIFNELYYPRLDQACARDLGLIVTDGRDFFSEEKRDTRSEVRWLAPGVPAFHITNTHHGDRYRIEKEILADPRHDAVLQRTRFVPLRGKVSEYHVYALLAPHLGNRGRDNTAWVGRYKDSPMLFAQRDNLALALACSLPWQLCSVGFVGASDGWQDLNQHKQMTWLYQRAQNGNVALTAEAELGKGNGEFLLAIGFGRNAEEAGCCAHESLQDGFDRAQTYCVAEWETWRRTLTISNDLESQRDLSYQSASVLRVHESKAVAGGVIASLSIPWGQTRSDEDIGGYHLVWPRDLAEAGGGLLAVGAHTDVRRVLGYLERTQRDDGHWPQNMWIDGSPYWEGIQLDEAALPILLVNLARREKMCSDGDINRLWPMVRRAANFIVLNGPVTLQDRWEEDPGYSPLTLAASISALLAAADLAEVNGEAPVASFLRETADFWNDNIERWTYVTGTDLAKRLGVDGYYVRIAPPESADAASPTQGFVPIKNRPPGQSNEPATHMVSPDALALVRFGLRPPHDPRIVNTVKVIDALLKVETPAGPCWHRYNGDGYGEHAGGSPFDGTGIGRAWPLLTGERAHYELAAGHREEAFRLFKTMESFASKGGLIPEQIWDASDLPEKELFCGNPSGSAMPLVWAHAEYLKLRRSLKDGRIFDLPRQSERRYLEQEVVSPYAMWQFSHRCRAFAVGKTLRIAVHTPAVVHWTSNDWSTKLLVETRDTGCGLHIADLPTRSCPCGTRIEFTFFWVDSSRWEGANFSMEVVQA